MFRATSNPLLALTARDLMSREVVTVSADMPLKEAAAELAGRGIHGAPVVDRTGRYVGVLSVSDLARRTSEVESPRERRPQTCSFQEACREPHGRETTLCTLAEGVCPLQRLRAFADGKEAVACTEPNCVPVDWQMVELEALPGDAVRDCMTTTIIACDAEARVPELARLMLDRHVHRLVVLDDAERPVGVVTANDLLQLLAHPELSHTELSQ